MTESTFEIRFRELQVRFVERMITDRKKLDKYLTDLKKSKETYAPPLRVLHMFAHQYNGSGQTFGFASVSKVAHELEAKLAKIQSSEDLVSSLSEIESLTDALAQEFTKAIGRAS